MPPIVTGPALAASVAQTKYRVPRVRRDAVRREALLARLRESVAANDATLVVAPAGYGKTTLLAQLAESLAGEADVVWIAVDEDDDDANRFFAHLVRAVEPLGLAFEEEPEALIATVLDAGRQARAAIGALVNALCTSAAARIVLVVDDMHRVTRPEIGVLLEALIERLPEHVGLVLGGRSLPPLPVPRWIVRGEAAQFGPADLRFAPSDAAALAVARIAPLDAGELESLVGRVDGWPAGVAMLLRARGAAAEAVAHDTGEQHLYDYLAEEVLGRLPEDLQRFVVDCSVLAELRPQICEAVAGRDDARALLRSLYRRDLFVTAIDGATPVLRFHDLFREFLLHRLDGEPERRRLLHSRAAAAETQLARVIGHRLAAAEWDAALARLVDGADALLATGGHEALERWLDRIPSAARDWRWHHLSGICAWRRRDWFRARDALSAALADAGAAMPPRLRARALLYRMGSANGVGARDAALAAAGEIADLPLDPPERAVFAMQRAWNALHRGDHGQAVAALREASTLALADPAAIAVHLADAPHTSYIGLPGAAAAYRELLAAWDAARGAALAPWHAVPAIADGWLALWTGDRARAAAAIARARDLTRRFGASSPVEDGLLRLIAFEAGLTGRSAEMLRICAGLVARFDAPELAGLRVAFESTYVHGYLRASWAAGERDAYVAMAPRALRPPRPEELAYVAMAARVVAGQCALLEGHWSRAAEAFESVLPAHDAGRFPQAHGDPRAGLAYARLMQGRRAEALAALEPLLGQAVAEDAIGPLLWEPAWLVTPLLDALAPERRGGAELAPLLARLADWHAAHDAGRRAAVGGSATGPRAEGAGAVPEGLAARDGARRSAGPLATLSEREYEVLVLVADGASNKEIARDLDLSLHTVKRHIANILGKLDCVSRRQAADLLRGANRGARLTAGA